jgi:hypothetical protein
VLGIELGGPEKGGLVDIEDNDGTPLRSAADGFMIIDAQVALEPDNGGGHGYLVLGD